jgi:putative ABC transport system ATP-binding protein
VGLDGRSEHLVEELSGGEQQRVAIARALVGDPEVVLADEPTAELDERNRRTVITMLLKVPTSGRTLLLATHDPDVAAACDHTLHLRDGRVVPAG